MKPTGVFFQWVQVPPSAHRARPAQRRCRGQAGLGSVAVLPTSISVKEEERLCAHPSPNSEARRGKCYCQWQRDDHLHVPGISPG